MSKKTNGQELQEKLTWKFPHIAKEAPQQMEKASKFCEGYKEFLNGGKTERECVRLAVRMLKKAGYKPFDPKASYEPGDKVYYVNREKSVIATTFGKKPLTDGLRINGAHIDSPRLDLKPNPVYEKEDIAYFKTHYYGGIRKYQWGTIPLSMHGVIVKKDGEKVEISIGEKEGDPVFCVTDLLPHLAAKQNDRKLAEGIKGEELNIVVGSVPFQDEDVKEPVKLLALQILNEMYGITEHDFYRAEIEMVPAHKAADVGSNGNTGLDSDYVLHYIEDLADQAGVKARDVLRNSLCLSSDVNAAYDPTFSDVYEARNSSYINKGCVLTKYTGARGKSGSNDASAETMAKVIGIMDSEGVYWQAGELGAVDAGGGGTIAKFVAGMDVDTVDLGVPILSMHAPFELASKLDVYNTYKAFKAFYK